MGDWGWSHLKQSDKRAILRGLSDGSVHGGPYHVELQPSDRCDIDCFFCSTRSHRIGAELPLETIRALTQQMKAAGVYSTTLCGGGEPLVYRHILPLFRMLRKAGIAIDHLTTNGTRLTPRCSEALLDGGCREVIISLNTSRAHCYAGMMRTSEATFHRVVDNIRQLVELRGRRSTPQVILQFMLLRENFRTLPRMYDLAESLGVDGILFREPAFLPAGSQLNDDETEEMMQMLESLLLEDRFRLIRSIDSFHRDISGSLSPVISRVTRRQAGTPFHRTVWNQFRNRHSSLREKWRRFSNSRHRPATQALLGQHGGCVALWHTMTVRADGSVPVCCVRQTSRLASVEDQCLEDIWYGDAFQHARRQMHRALQQGRHWAPEAEEIPALVPMCSWDAREGLRRCIFRNFYYSTDHRFVRRLHKTVHLSQSLAVPSP